MPQASLTEKKIECLSTARSTEARIFFECLQVINWNMSESVRTYPTWGHQKNWRNRHVTLCKKHSSTYRKRQNCTGVTFLGVEFPSTQSQGNKSEVVTWWHEITCTCCVCQCRNGQNDVRRAKKIARSPLTQRFSQVPRITSLAVWPGESLGFFHFGH